MIGLINGALQLDPKTDTQRNAIADPAEGLLIYNSDNSTIDHYNNTAWRAGGCNAEMYLFENTIQATINHDNQWHPALGYTAGKLINWTHESGSTIDILSFSDYSGTVSDAIKVTTNGAHGYLDGNPAAIVGPNVVTGGVNPYYGIYNITTIDADEYYFINSGWNATTTAVSILPDRLIAGVGAKGSYRFNGTASLSAPSNNEVYDFRLFHNYTGSMKAEGRFGTKLANEWSSGTGSMLIDIEVGDSIWFAVKNILDSTNVLIRSGNLNLVRD